MNQQELFPTSQLPTGDRHQKMLEVAIKRAREDGYLDQLDEGAISLARANAAALDQAETDRKYYAVAQLSGPYLEILTSLKLVPTARDTGEDDAISQALAELSTPTVRNT